MKILEISGSGSVGTDSMGPVTNVIFQLSLKFRELGHEVIIADVNNGKERSFLPSDIKLIKTDAISRSMLVAPAVKRSFINRVKVFFDHTRKTWKNEAKFIEDIEAQVDLNSFDIIHVHQWRPAYLLQKKYKNCVYTIHTPNKLFGKFQNHSVFFKPYESLTKTLGIHEISVIKKSLFSVALGAYVKENLFNINNIKLIHNGINLDEWEGIDKSKAKKVLGYKESDRLILFVGAINQRKGVHVLLEAIKKINPDIKNLKVAVIGSLDGTFNDSGRMTPYARKIVEDAENLPVDIIGFVSNRSKKFRTYLSAADIFVVPSLFDNQPTVILEALAMGIPVVASEVGGIPDMVTEDVGVTFKVGSSSELAEKLSYLIGNPDILNKMKLRCRSYIEKHYTWSQSAEIYLNEFVKSRL